MSGDGLAHWRVMQEDADGATVASWSGTAMLGWEAVMLARRDWRRGDGEGEQPPPGMPTGHRLIVERTQ